MKILLFIMSLVIVSPSWSAILVMGSDGKYTQKSTLSAAATSADTVGKTIVVTSALSAVQSNISSASVHSWPLNRVLKVEKGGSINPTTKFTGLPTVTPEMFGATGDGVTDDLSKLRIVALAAPQKVIFQPGKSYKISSNVVWGDNTILEGYGSTIITTGQSGFGMGSNSKILGLNFDSRTAPFPMWAIYSDSKQGLLVTDGTFQNGRIYLKDDSGIEAGESRIERNKFICDYTTYNYTVDQIDPISFYGQHKISIIDNIFTVTNSHRVIKISDASYGQPAGTVSPYNTRNVLISGNVITGSTTSNKQVIDAYLGASEVIVSNNFVETTGWAQVFENKTGEATTAGTPLNTTITGNYFKNSLGVLSFQGAYGATVTANDNHISATTISNNTLIGGTTNSVTARFYNTVKISNNVITIMGGGAYTGVGVYSSRDVSILDNTIYYGIIDIGRLTTNHTGATYSGNNGVVSIQRNRLIGWINANAGIQIANTNSTAVFEVKNNFIAHGTVASGTNRAVYATGVTARLFEISDNVFEGTAANPILSGIMDVFVLQYRNSWDVTTTYGTAIPTSQSYIKGSRIVNTNTSVGSIKGWTTTTAGGAYASTTIDTTAYSVGTWIKWDSGTTVWSCSTSGTTTSPAPSIVGKVVGDTVTDGTVVWTMRNLTAAVFTSEGVL